MTQQKELEQEWQKSILQIQKELESLKLELSMSMNKELSVIADDKNSLLWTLDLKLEQMKDIVLH